MTNVIPLKSIKTANTITAIGEFTANDKISIAYLEYNNITLNGTKISLGESFDIPIEFYAADTNKFGIVKLNDDINSNSITLAATANSVNAVYLSSKNASNLNTGIVNNSQLPKANITQEGIVQLNDDISSNSITLAATANSVKYVYDSLSNLTANVDSITSNVNNASILSMGTIDNSLILKSNTTQEGIVKLNDDISSNSVSLAATANTVNFVYETALKASNASNLNTGIVNNSQLPKANITQEGIVRLYDGIDSDSITLAATANSIKTLSELKLNSTGGEITGDLTITGNLRSKLLTTDKVLIANSGIISESNITASSISNHLGSYHVFPNISSISGNTTIDSIDTNSSADYLIEMKQSGNIQVRKILLLGNNDSYILQEYAQANTNGDLFNLSAEIVEGKVKLNISVGDTTTSDLKIIKS